MELNEKIRSLRELNHLTQEEMAEKLNISRNGYVKIERGEVRPSIDRLIQIANIFAIDIADLIKKDNGAMIFVVGDNSNDNNNATFNYYNSTAGIAAENEKLKLIIAHKEELITQQKSEIETLKMLVSSLQKQISNN